MSECDKYQEMISQMLDGELPEPHKTELVRHIGCCPDCRRVYDAFSAISLSLGETAAPEGFAGGVMAAVRTRGEHGSGRSKTPGKSLARYLALAACLVLAVLATVRLALPSGGRTDGAVSGAPQAAQFGVAAAPCEIDPRGAGGAETAEPDEGFAADDEAPSADASEDGAAAVPGLFSSNGAQALSLDAESISSIDVSAEGLSRTITDEEDILAIAGLLSPASGGEPEELGDEYCSLDINYDEGSSSLNVYVSDGRLICRTGEGLTYPASGSPEEFALALSEP